MENKMEDGIISDGFGSHWRDKCWNCGSPTQIVRPGKAQCSQCNEYPTEVIYFE